MSKTQEREYSCYRKEQYEFQVPTINFAII